MKYFILPLVVLALFISCENKQYKLVWSEEFNGNSLDTSRWNVVIGNGCPNLCGFGNNELQYYTDESDNLFLKDGILHIVGEKDSIGDNAYKSVKLTTEDKGDFTSGRIEVRAKLPKGTGTWPAIWMLPTLDRNLQWPKDGEIDIMEHVGYNPDMIYGTIHTENNNHTLGTQIGDSLMVDAPHENFNTYILQWDENSLSWIINETKYLIIDKSMVEGEWPFNKPFHIILNLAIGGNWGGKYGVDDSIWPQTFEIDYVNVYQKL